MKKLMLLGLLTVGTLANFNMSVAQAQVEMEDQDAEFRAFCERTLRTLERARGMAANASRSGAFSESSQILIDALNQNIVQYGDVNPITFNLITHARNVGLMLQNTAGSDLKAIKATTIAMESFYDLIFETAHKIDYQSYRCYGPRRNCRYSRTLQFERNVLEMVTGMLSLANTDLLVSRGNQVFPIGPSNTYLKASEIIANAAHSELRQLAYGTAYSCEILDLQDMADDLTDFNRMSQTESVKRQKIYQVSSDINSIIRSLNSDGCRRY